MYKRKILVLMVTMFACSQTNTMFQGVLNCIIFPCLVLVGPVFLVYMLYNCYHDNGVTSSSFVELLFSIFPKLPGAIESVSNTYHQTQKQVKDMSRVKSENRASILSLNLYNEPSELMIPRIDDIANTTAMNETARDVWTECNVILLPFLVFSFFCLIILYVLCKYKLCSSTNTEKQVKAANE